MQQALIRYQDDSYEEYFFTHTLCYGHNTYGSIEELLASSEYLPDLIQYLSNNFVNWVLVLGEVDDVVFLGYALEGGVMAYGSVDTIADWIQDLAWGILDDARVGQDCMTFGHLLEAPSLKQSLSYLQDLGVIPQVSQLPLNGRLTPILSPEGAKYWMAPVDDV